MNIPTHQQFYCEMNDFGRVQWLYNRIVELEQKYEQVKSENVRLCSLVAKFEDKYNEENTCRIAELEVMVEQNNRISEVERKIDFIDTEHISIGTRLWRVDTKHVRASCCNSSCVSSTTNPSGRCRSNLCKLHTLTKLEILHFGDGVCNDTLEIMSNKNVKYITTTTTSSFPDLDGFPSCHTLMYDAHTRPEYNTISLLVSSLSIYKHNITRIAIGDQVGEDRTILKNYCKMNNIQMITCETVQREMNEIMKQ